MIAEFGTGQVLWSLLWFFLFLIWVMLVFRVFGELLRNDEMSGTAKMLWTVAVVTLPYIGAFRISRRARRSARAVDAGDDRRARRRRSRSGRSAPSTSWSGWRACTPTARSTTTVHPAEGRVIG